MHRIYLDHNATTPLHPAIRALYQEGIDTLWGNASSPYEIGQKSKRALEEARRKILRRLGTQTGELVFTSGGTESINWVLRSLYQEHGHRRNHFISSPSEHHATVRTLNFLAHRGAEITWLSLDRAGRIDLDELKRVIRPTTLGVSLMAANNETGLVHPVQAIGEIAQAHGVVFHCDAVCALGKIPIDLTRWPIDFLSFSAHKFYGPKGIGGLYIKKHTSLTPLFYGGLQERGARAGTENTPAIVAMAEALGLAYQALEANQAHFSALRKKLRAGLEATIPGLICNTLEDESVTNTLNISIPGLDAEAVVIALDLEGICVSTGSACTSGATEPSHVLLALGSTAQEARGSIRFSLGFGNTESDIDTVIDIFPNVVKRLR